MGSERIRLKLKPGQKVTVTVDGSRVEGQLLNPVRAGYPDRLWWVLFTNGAADAFAPEEMEAAE